MLALSEQGDNETVDMLVGDIYGSDYSKLGLKSTMIASTFGKVFKKQGGKKRMFKAEDISKSLLYAISNNIGQIAYVMFCSYSVGTRILFVRRSHARTNLGTRLPAGSKLTSSIISRYMNAEKYNLDRIYFGGYFIRGASLSPRHHRPTSFKPGRRRGEREIAWSSTTTRARPAPRLLETPPPDPPAP